MNKYHKNQSILFPPLLTSHLGLQIFKSMASFLFLVHMNCFPCYLYSFSFLQGSDSAYDSTKFDISVATSRESGSYRRGGDCCTADTDHKQLRTGTSSSRGGGTCVCVVKCSSTQCTSSSGVKWCQAFPHLRYSHVACFKSFWGYLLSLRDTVNFFNTSTASDYNYQSNKTIGCYSIVVSIAGLYLEGLGFVF